MFWFERFLCKTIRHVSFIHPSYIHIITIVHHIIFMKLFLAWTSINQSSKFINSLETLLLKRFCHETHVNFVIYSCLPINCAFATPTVSSNSASHGKVSLGLSSTHVHTTYTLGLYRQSESFDQSREIANYCWLQFLAPMIISGLTSRIFCTLLLLLLPLPLCADAQFSGPLHTQAATFLQLSQE